MTHTKGVLSYHHEEESGHYSITPPDKSELAMVLYVDNAPCEQGKADARRLVASWNALEGFDIAAIEAGVVKELVEAAQGLGAMPEGFCFCHENRIGDDSKVHYPECHDLRAALAKLGGAL